MQTTPIPVRLTYLEKEELKAQASKNNQSLNSYIRSIIIRPTSKNSKPTSRIQRLMSYKKTLDFSNEDVAKAEEAGKEFRKSFKIRNQDV